jgi:hypothetical protein
LLTISTSGDDAGARGDAAHLYLDFDLGVMTFRARFVPAPGRACRRSARFGGASLDSTVRARPDCMIVEPRRTAAVAERILRRTRGGTTSFRDGRPLFGM